MSIPLVQDNNKDSINTSIIAIKRYIERINMLLGLSNSEEIDTSVFATKDELQQAITELSPVDEVTLNNMQSVTSNAVAKELAFNKGASISGTSSVGWGLYVDLGIIPSGKYAIIVNQSNFDGLAIQTSSTVYLSFYNSVGIFTVPEGGSVSNVYIAGYANSARAISINAVLLKVS